MMILKSYTTSFLCSTVCFLLLLSSFPSLTKAGSNEASVQWLAENAKKEGVTTLPSGLQYKTITKGSGKYHPTVNTPCLCHYHGTLIDGSTFDSSYDRGSPTTFAPNQVIKGWTEAMQLMVEGDKLELYIPSELAYGDRGSPPKIGGGDALIFIIEMLEIKGDKVLAITCDVSTGEDCSEKEMKYVEKIKTKTNNDVEKMKSEIERIDRMMTTVVKPDLKQWGDQRKYILNQLIEQAEVEEPSEL